MRPFVLVLALTLLAPATGLACGGPAPGKEIKSFLGWTSDGRYLAYELTDSVGWEDEIATGTFAAVYDIVTEKTKTYCLGIEGFGPEHDEEQDKITKWKRMAGKKAWAKWKSTHRVILNKNRDSCGDARLLVELDDVHGYADDRVRSSWKDNTFRYSVSTAAVLRLGVIRNGQTYLHAEASHVQQGFSLWSSGKSVTVAWSPDCRMVAWSLHGLVNTPGRFGEPIKSPLVVKPVGPIVHVMAHKNAKASVDPSVAAIAKAGFVAHVGPDALKDRDASVVYAWKASRSDAERIAKALPGGATVEAMTWSTPADVIVAVGRSAAP